MSFPTFMDQRRARREVLSSLVAASSADVVLTGLEPPKKHVSDGHMRSTKLSSKSLKKGYKIDTTLLGGNLNQTKSLKRKAESKKAEKELRKQKGLIDALFPDDAGHPTGREFHASSTNQGMCDYVEFALRASLSKNATPEAFNNAIVPYDNTAVQALAIVIEEVARSQVELWKEDLLPLLKKLKVPKNLDNDIVVEEQDIAPSTAVAVGARVGALDSDSNDNDDDAG
jgi:hypothetical protein